MKTIKENLLRNIGVGKVKLIEKWLTENVRIVSGNFVINKDFTIDVSGSITITNIDLVEFPEYIQFNKVSGSFSCTGCNKLISLRGCPKDVYEFDCMKCSSLKTLEGGPQEVRGNYYCSTCNSLINLKGSPKKIGRHFSCRKCLNIASLKGGPQSVEANFYCDGCSKLDNIRGLAKNIGWNFICYDCKREFTTEEVREISSVRG